MSPRLPHAVRIIAGSILFLLAVLLGMIGAVIGFFGFATVMNALVGLAIAGLTVCLGTAAAVGMLASHVLGRSHPARGGMAVGVGTVVLVTLLAAITFFRPLSPPAVRVPLPAGAGYWDLPTGSHIAYRRIQATGIPKATPVIRLHGGPGAFAVANESAIDYYRPLGQDRFTVYFYDQIGSGLSARLENPADYTGMRHVEDLEAIRQTMGAGKIILFGESYGATLIANYMAKYPEHVEKAIFSSPGAINPAEWKRIDDPQTPRGAQLEQRKQEFMYQPRFMAAYALQLVNPRAARDFVPDSELDGYWDNFLATAFESMTCKGGAAAQVPHGFGGWSALRTGNDFYSKQNPLNPRGALADNETPVLILKGECDYIKWAVSYQYKETFPRSTMLYFPQAGHVIYWDKPELYLKAIRAFLLDQPLPIAPHTSSEPPVKR